MLRVWLRFLGSMNLAVTLFVAISVASVIGTVLRQNEPLQNYLIKVGPFWHRVFHTLGLYDVYGAFWFLLILGFLVVSTTICVIRTGPVMVRQMREFREHIQDRSLARMSRRGNWNSPLEPATAGSVTVSLLQRLGYRTLTQQDKGRLLVAAKRGAANRLGYLFTHIAIVVICVGGLLDGNIPLRISQALGAVSIETRDLPISQIPGESRLPSSNPSFRASILLPEGGRANSAFLNLSEGYLLQELPFTIELREFRIEHYPNGQPRSFESDLVIHDAALEGPLEQTIAVNHPLSHRGYTIYQASFADGGSRLRLNARPFGAPEDVTSLEGAVHQTLTLETPEGPLRLELDDFRLFNVNPAAADDPLGRQFVNYGPSFGYKLRWPTGEAREYVTYMSPVPVNGRPVFLSGVRASPAEEFRYLHLPADEEASPRRFLDFVASLRDRALMAELSAVLARQAVSGSRLSEDMVHGVEGALTRLMDLFNEGGFDSLVSHVEQVVPEAERDTALETYLRMLHSLMFEAYLRVLDRGDGERVLSEHEALFFDDAVRVASTLPLYRSPLFLELLDFEQVQASGLQITRSPGKNVVYLGFLLLVIGLFLMFYLPHERLWVSIRGGSASPATVLLAGQRTRHERDFIAVFARVERLLRQHLGDSGNPPQNPQSKAAKGLQ